MGHYKFVRYLWVGDSDGHKKTCRWPPPLRPAVIASSPPACSHTCRQSFESGGSGLDCMLNLVAFACSLHREEGIWACHVPILLPGDKKDGSDDNSSVLSQDNDPWPPTSNIWISDRPQLHQDEILRHCLWWHGSPAPVSPGYELVCSCHCLCPTSHTRPRRHLPLLQTAEVGWHVGKWATPDCMPLRKDIIWSSRPTASKATA